jgi:heme oxygenase
LAVSPILEGLRAATAAAHARLEAGLDLLGEPLSRDRFVAVLSRFLGFHRAWEPAVARALGPEALAERGRTALIEADLERLGMAPTAIAALPVCAAAAAVGGPAGALGSLYVVEGSTLGGQVIARALKDAPWLPPGGLSYFDPYGARTGAMWRAFRSFLDDHAAAHDRDALYSGARDTFALLQDWLTAAPG